MKKNYNYKKYLFAKIMLALLVLLSCTWSINAQQYSLDFDGTNDHVSFNTPSGFPTGSSPYTLEAWVYPDAMGDKGIVGWGNYGVTNGANALRLLPNGIRHYWWGNDLDATTTTLTGAWHHIAATCSSTERKIYLDGVLVASQNVTVSQHTVPAPINLTIGKTSSNEIFDGKIDNVRIWTVARTQGEIQAGMTASYGAGTPGLAASYNFNEGSGTLVTDSVNPSANNGTLQNFALSGTTSNWVAAIPAIRYVKQGGTGNGTSWAAASGDLQGMINVSVAVDEVWVAAGTYQRGAGESFSMKSGVKIYGGFPAAGNPGMADRNLAVNFTILQGNGNRVIMNNNIDTAARLDGFVIQGGQLSGVQCGAGVYNLNSSPIIANCIIRNNTTPEWGGGFYNRFGNAKIVNCLIYGNTAGGGGGAFEHGAQSTFANCTFSANNSNVNGGAVHTHENGTLTLNNSILWSNNAAAAGDEVFTTGSSTVAAFYSIVANEAGDISGNFTGPTAIYVNPGFTDATNNNYTLAFDSPALNTGNNSYISGYTTDLAGNPRINSAQVDMGPYERQFAIQPDTNGIMYVKKGATGEGASWNNAVGELADALKQAKFINDATPGKVKQIWVAKGTYKPMYRADNLNSTNTTAYENAFVLVNSVKVYGNFAGTETSISERNLANTANKTILSGDFAGNDTYGPTGQATANYAENAEHVVIAAGTGVPELDGFTITGGNATYNTNYITVNGATQIASNKGGGLYVINSQPVISNIIFKGNRGGEGGGVYNINSASQYKNILIAGNTSLGSGGGYSNSGNTGEPALTNITITNNTALNAPAGLYANNSAPVHLKNSIVWNNTANGAQSGSSAVRNYNNIIDGGYYNSSTLFNTDFGIDMGGNSSANPLFTNEAAGDFSLTASSPAVNSGNNASFTDAQNSKDILGNPRVTASVIDMGAYEHANPALYAPDANGIMYVVKGATGTGNSWNNAIGELANSIRQAKLKNDATPATVKEIWVAKGTYKPLYRLGAIDNNPLDRNNAFVVSNDVKIYGHFTGTESAISQRNLTNAANKTILSGDLGSDDTYGTDGQLTANFADNAYHVVVAATATGSEMSDFTVTGGNAVSTISTTVNSNTITGNMGSGIYAAYGTPLFTNIIVKGNRDTYGASVYPFESNATFKNMLITGNYSSNSASGFQIGGTMGAPVMINSTITKNTSAINATGISSFSGGGASIYNSILWGNTAGGSSSISNVKHYNNIVQGSTSAGSWSNSAGINMGANSSGDPLFTNFNTGDFTLQSASPAVDSGNAAHFSGAADAKDIAGNNRLRGASIDIGVYESAFFGPVDANGVMYVVKGAAGQGSSWNNAIGELADALKNAKRLNDAIPGRVKQIWAAKGVYKPIYRADNLDSNQPTSTINAFVLVNDVKVYGHFAGTETTLAERNFANAANKTTLSGDLGNNDTYSANGHLTGNFYDNVAHVVVCAGTGVPQLDGFTIKGGYGSGSNITVNGVSGIPSINGSGIIISNSQPIISNIILTGNRDYAGGTIWNENSASQFFNLVIASNTSQTACAGFCQSGTLATPVLTNATITKNASVNSLTAVAAISGTVQVKNSIIWDNTTNSNTSFGGVKHYNNLIQGGTNSNGSFNTQVGEDMGGNINADPLFTDAANGIYAIPFTSPAANAGSTSSYANAGSATDVAGNPRLDGNSIDMGAYESIMPPPPEIRYVKPVATGTGDGSDWDNASADIQAMINGAGVEQVWVAAGTYKPTIIAGNGYDNRNKAFVLKTDVKVYGGFAGYETDLEDRDWATNVTTLSGDLGTVNNISDNACHVVISVDNVGTAVLDGFTITGGNTLNAESITINSHYIMSSYGSGIFCVESSPVFSNLIIKGNRATNAGGGIHIGVGSWPVFSNVVISNNTCTSNIGGGMHNWGSPILINVTISGNTGSGIESQSFSSPILTNVTVIGNTGNGIKIGSGPFTLNNCTISGNGSYGLVATGATVLNNTIVYGNQYGVMGSPNFNNSLVQGITNVTGGNINGLLNPLFVNAPSYTTAPFTGGDYSLMGCSPVLNMGNNSYIATETDLEGSPRIYNNTVDLGAYELQSLPVSVSPAQAEAQIFEPGATVADLVATGNDLKWYDVATFGTPLAGSTPLISATYYVTQTIDGCESPRTAVAVTINYQVIYYVKTTPSGTGDGTSWDNASDDIQAMINNSGADQVWVAAGTYKPSVIAGNGTSERNKAFVLKNDVKVYGGFIGNESDISDRDWENNVTILSGDLGVENDISDNAYHMIISTGNVGIAQLDGFTITGANSDGYDVIEISSHYIGSDYGGGIVCVASSPVFANLIITGNRANWAGAGVYNELGASSVFSNVVISNNEVSAGAGAGMYNNESSPILNNVTINGNTGDGIENNSNASPILNNVAIKGNTNNGITNNASVPVLNNLVISGNGDYGIVTDSSVTLNNSTVSGNGFYGLLSFSTIVLNNSIVYGNQYGVYGSATYHNSLVQDVIDVSEGNIDGLVDPVFVDAPSYTNAPFTGGDYSLRACSPVLNMGNNDYVNTATDLAGSPRIYNNTVDLGAYEYQSLPGSGILAPAAQAQSFVLGATVADLVAEGSGLKWYDVSTMGAPLDESTQLLSGTYYVSQMTEGCESPRTAVAVTVNYPAIVYVKTIASGNGNGTSWANASDDIQAMINGSGVQQVWVASGEYQPAAGQSFTMKANVKIYGGFPTTGNPAMFERNVKLHETILSGNGNRVIDNNSNALTATAILDGFIIEGGAASDNGGGMRNISSYPAISNCIFRDNTAGNWGGAMLNQGNGTVTVTNCLFYDNQSTGGGANFDHQNAKTKYTNVTFADNISSGNGGAVHTYTNAAVTFYNCIFYGNTAGSSGNNILSSGGGTIMLYKCMVTPGNYGLSGGYSSSGLISGNPLFKDAANGDYSLQSLSPAIDAGTTSYFAGAASANDLAGSVRLFGAAIDLGPYEYTPYCSITTVWDGNSWNNGNPVSYEYAAIFEGSYNSAVHGEVTACSLTVNSGTVVVNSGTVFNVDGAVNVNPAAILKFENNAHLMQGGFTNTNTGDAVVHRNSSQLFRQDYTMWSSPVEGQEIRDFSTETLYNRFYTYNSVANYFVSMFASEQASDGVNFGTGQGYLIRMPNGAPEAGYVEGTTSIIYDGIFTGTPNNGNMQIAVTPASPGVLGYNAIGNPYPSPISIPAFFAANNANTDGTIYLWRKKNGSDIASAYCTLNSVGEYVGNGQLETQNPNGFIQTGQGFIVKALNSTVTFGNFMRSSTTAHDSSFFRMSNNNTPPADEAHRVWLNLSKENVSVAQMLVGYRSNATMGIDLGIDAPFINDVQTGLNSLLDDKAYAIQGRSLPFNNQDVVPLQFKTNVAGSYSIAIDHVDGLFLGSQDIFLKDNLLNVTHDIKASGYSFTSDTGVFNSRFEVVYVTNALGTDDPEIDANTIIIYKQDRNIVINSGTAVMANVKVFDTRGRLVYERSDINASETVISDLRAEEQMLIVQVTTIENSKVSKKVIY